LNLYRIEVTPFPMLLAEMIAGGRSGTLTIIREPVRKVTYWADGELVLVASKSLRESLGAYLFRRRLINDAQALQLTPEDWTDSVRLIHETEIPLHNKDTLLREWATGMVLPLFSLTDGSAIFEDEPPLPAPLRVPMRSMPAMVLEGVRSIRDGLVLRRSLGDLQRVVMPSRAPLYEVGSLPLTAAERAVVTAFQTEEPLEGFLRRVGGDSATTSRTVILMLALGSMVAKTEQSVSHGGPPEEASDPQRDLQLLAAIGGEDGRSLKVIGLARQLTSMSHYQVLKVPTRATRVEIMQRAAELKKRFDPATFPPIVWEYAEAVRRRIDEAGSLLQDPVRRAEYDSILRKTEGAHLHYTTQQRVARREFAEKNYRKSIELSARGDYYAAIVLLKQAVEFAPDHTDAWVLLGTCQERNPLWHRDATESYEKALSLNPNHVEALLCLGDLYRNQGLSSRAESCWEDVLQIDPVNPHALKRLKRHPKKEKGKEDA
jgi:tetratricopeptide (TPR) repeat protein